MAMIAAIHLLIYADDAEATRSFLRDVSSAGGTRRSPRAPRDGSSSRAARARLACIPRIRRTRESRTTILVNTLFDVQQPFPDDCGTREQRCRVHRSGEEQQFGITVMLKVPGADDIMLYEPRHPTAFNL